MEYRIRMYITAENDEEAVRTMKRLLLRMDQWELESPRVCGVALNCAIDSQAVDHPDRPTAPGYGWTILEDLEEGISYDD